jgi:AbrB family looped-hinge helix DNA binding protein
MRELTSRVTSKGQITLPVEIRRLLRIEPRDRVAFIVDGDQVRLRRTLSVASRTAGMLASGVPPLSPEKEREAAEQAIADEAEPRAGL